MSEAQNNDAFGDSAKDLLERLNNETRTRALRDRPGAVDRAIWRQIALCVTASSSAASVKLC